MRAVTSSFVGAVLAVLTGTGAGAQSYYDDQACRQYADAQVTPLRNQAGAETFGSALLGASVGAAIGGAVGGGRGAGIAGRALLRRQARRDDVNAGQPGSAIPGGRLAPEVSPRMASAPHHEFLPKRLKRRKSTQHLAASPSRPPASLIFPA